MGWDAFSSAERSKNGRQLKYKKDREGFKNASKFVVAKTGGVDGFLRSGGLDCSLCRDMMERAAENSHINGLNWGLCWSDEGMQPREVNTMQAFCNWDFKYKEEDAWAYWSAREFVRVCADNLLSIRFTY